MKKREEIEKSLEVDRPDLRKKLQLTEEAESRIPFNNINQIIKGEGRGKVHILSRPYINKGDDE